MSGTSAFLRRSCWPKSANEIPASTPCSIKICQFDSKKRGQDKKIWWVKESALANNCLFFNFMSEPVWYSALCIDWYFGSSCFLTNWVFKLLLYTEAGTETNCSLSRQMVNHGGVITFMSCNPFSDARKSLLCSQEILLAQSNGTSFWNFVTWCPFMLCGFSLRRFTLQSQRNLRNPFRKHWRKIVLHLWENDWNTWWKVRDFVWSSLKNFDCFSRSYI